MSNTDPVLVVHSCIEDYSLPVREMDGVFTTVARDEQSEEAMSFLFQDMMRHSVSPQVARSHALYPKVEADLTQSWKRDGCNRPHAQVWATKNACPISTNPNLNFCTNTPYVSSELNIKTHMG
ncbi:hypothetical protein BG000_005057 [Podila horticola]|nr:hypothetical protein BG000_005057 [Podila horticola]